jgi:hypothetical protein
MTGSTTRKLVPTPGALDVDRASVLPDDLVGDGEPEAGAAFLRRRMD